MSVTRRGFVRTIGLGTTALSTSFVTSRATDALAFGESAAAAEVAGPIIRLSSNENSRGPGQSALSALHGAVGRGNGRGYPPDHANDLMEALAAFWSVTKEDLIVGTGSGPILEGSVRAFCAADKPLVMKQAMEVFRRVLTTKSTAQG